MKKERRKAEECQCLLTDAAELCALTKRTPLNVDTPKKNGIIYYRGGQQKGISSHLVDVKQCRQTPYSCTAVSTSSLIGSASQSKNVEADQSNFCGTFLLQHMGNKEGPNSQQQFQNQSWCIRMS